ncbi:MFS transporter [Adlercreutzia shanghongiae]|uniref:MFS transporter n=1 Tax=Adlercreutzia shanghongiae TaxID=3111773 RepID=A0ABU6IXB4_9ACTN|nr:MFS transporter [Adlercreutzia sp. R22]MEC4294499.1 MFS transporter [Adlercreutzia sp. R22]
MHKEELTNGQSLRGFALATIAFMAIFAATAVPIPLYADYQVAIGLTTADISNTMFTYLTGVALTLLFAGRISDAFGRTPVTSLTLMLAILGCIMFMMADSGASVLAARFVQGLSAGFGMSAVSALVIDCVGDRHLSWGSTVASCGSMVGIMVGSVGVGVLYDIVPNLTVIYGVMIAILAVCLFLMPVVHEPLDQTLSLRAVMRVRIYIPSDNRRLFAVVCVCYLGTWLVSNFYQSFAAPIAYQCFGETSPMAGSLILAAIMAPSMLGGPLVQRFEPKATLAVSMVAVTVATALMALSILAGNELLFMADCALFSLAMGVAVSVSLRLLLLRVSVLRVSAILASVNLVAYAGSALTGVLSGWLLRTFSYVVVFLVMAAVLMAASAFVATCLRAPSEKKKDARLTLSRFHKMKKEAPVKATKAGSAAARQGASAPAPETALEEAPAPLLS